MDTTNHINLLSATVQGDQKAFEELYRDTSGKLFAVSYHLLQRRELAEEALQEAFVRIWHNASEYSHERGSVLSWMISIVRYRALDMMRAAKVRNDHIRDGRDSNENSPESDESIERISPEIDLSIGREKAKIDRCMAHLEKPQADAIILAYFRGFTHHEVCRQMEHPLGSVKSWIRRGLQRLKRCIET